MTATLDRELLARIGTVLYGEHWQAPMARNLGRSMHTVSRWSRGQSGPSLAVWQRFLNQLHDRNRYAELIRLSLSDALILSTESDRQISRKEKPNEPDQYLEPAAPNQDTGAR